MIRRFLSLFLLFLATTLPLRADPHDRHLVGTWHGMRDGNTTCQFLAWTTTYYANGTFSVTFFKDKFRKKLSHQEVGLWSTKVGKIKLSTFGVPTPDEYTYEFKNENTVLYKRIKADISGDCGDQNYYFIDHRLEDGTS